jgi:hypothetical protein
MATFTIESNGRIERTAVYYNGEQISGIKEIFVNLDEDGVFDAVIQYEGVNKEIYTKNIFEDYLDNLKVVPPSFTEEEAMALTQLVIESEGDINSTTLLMDDEELCGVINLLIHIKSTKNSPSGLSSIFKKSIPNDVEFKSEITFRNDDDSTETERVF